MTVTGTARTNWFAVKDPEAFVKFVRTNLHGVDLRQEGGMFMITGERNESGMFPAGFMQRYECEGEVWPWGDDAPSWVEVDEAGEEASYDMVSAIAPHLAEGEVAVFMEISHEGYRSLDGWATAVTNSGDPVLLGLSDIYDMAKRKFKIAPRRIGG